MNTSGESNSQASSLSKLKTKRPTPKQQVLLEISQYLEEQLGRKFREAEILEVYESLVHLGKAQIEFLKQKQVGGQS